MYQLKRNSDKANIEKKQIFQMDTKHSTYLIGLTTEGYAYNTLIQKFLQSNNQTAIDLNKAMDIIGNCNNVRAMLQIVEHQKNTLNMVASTGESLSESINESEQLQYGHLMLRFGCG